MNLNNNIVIMNEYNFLLYLIYIFFILIRTNNIKLPIYINEFL